MKKLSLYLLALLFALTWTACQSPETQQPTYPNSDLLVHVTWLTEHLDDESVRIIDMRPEGFNEGHIPGAVNIPGVALLHDTENPIAHFLIDGDRFADLMGSIGLRNDQRVVIYDDGNSLFSARMFYALELYGHDKIHILNGGFAAWESAGFELATIPREFPVTTFSVRKNEDATCDALYIRDRIDDPNTIVFDARSAEEFRGEDVRAARAGHIPGAVNLEWSTFVYQEEDQIPFFRSYEEISQILADAGITPDKEVISHCHTNVRGSHAYFTLRLMGYDSVRAYEGSWSEYGNLPDAPISL